MKFSPQYLVVVNLLLLALAAYSASSIIDTLIAGRLMPKPSVELSDKPAVPPVQPPKDVAFYRKVTERDIFNSALAPTPAPTAAATIWQAPVKLIGVAVFRDPQYSNCVLEDLKSHKQSIYRIGNQIDGTDAVVKAIEWDRVIIEQGGQPRYLELPKAPEAASSVTANLSPSTAASGPAPPGAGGPQSKPANQMAKEAALDQNIQMVSENEYVIAQAEVDRAFENMSELFTQVRAVPHFEEGVSTGFRLFAIRPGSLFDKIGLKNGDVLQRINGTDLSDPSRALSLMQELRGERELTVDILRGKQPMTLSYQVR